MNVNPISMTIRKAMSLGRLNPAAPSLAGALRPLQTTPRMASKQLTRLSSTTARPVAATLNLDSRPHAKAASPSSIVVRTNSTSAPANNEVKLDWDSFFKLRASRRRYSLVSSVASSAISTSVGVQVLSGQDLEHLGATVMGLDPFVVLGLATATCGAIGWLLGPALGNGIWGIVYRKYKPSVNTKEKEFFDRIRRFRVDPSTNSIANPVPDYYGEKIGSVAGYRNWLKDQRAYNRKRRNFIA
ncbi:Mitochondrial import protein Pam17 [Penicillium expansum]|nr:Mitochondrial import protein Pam17 [Penicillium expansum]